MKVLVYGSNGWIGNQFIDILNKNNIQYVKGTSRVNCLEDLEQEINKNDDSCSYVYSPTVLADAGFHEMAKELIKSNK